MVPPHHVTHQLRNIGGFHFRPVAVTLSEVWELNSYRRNVSETPTHGSPVSGGARVGGSPVGTPLSMVS